MADEAAEAAAVPHRGLWRGDPALTYHSQDVEVVVLPQRGGKIASIRDRTGREWLTQPQRDLLPLTELPPCLIEGDMFGWDECAPTIDDCTIDGHYIPLHGDAWDQPWREGLGGWLHVTGHLLPYELSRKLVLVSGGFLLSYRAVAAARIPLLWAAHPQFAAEPLTSVILGDGSPCLVDTFKRGYWPDGGPRSPLTLQSVPPGGSAKVFADAREPVASAKLVQPDGASLRLEWDKKVVPYVGVWMDCASIGPVDAIAIEPMTGGCDSCAEAFANNTVLRLEPDHPVSWSLKVTIEPND